MGIADAKPDNVVRHDDGVLALIDIKAFRPDGKALEWLRQNSDPLALAAHRAKRQNEGGRSRG